MNNFFEKLSFKQKIISGFSVLSAILILGMGYMLFEFSRVSNLSTNIIEQHQPITRSASNALEYSKSAANHLHKFLLNGELSSIKNYSRTLKKIKQNIQSLDTYAQDLNLVMNVKELTRASIILEEINSHVKQIEELSKNYEANHPIIDAAANVLNPLAIDYLGLLNTIIEQNTNSDISKEALMQLSDMRHGWAQMLSSLRITLATRQAREFKNVKAYADVNKMQMEKIKAMNLDLGLEGIDDLEIIRNEYMKELEIVINKFNTTRWRMDAHIMTNKIMPLFDELESYLKKLENIQLNETKKADSVLTEHLDNAYYSFIALIFVGLIAAFVISGFITHSLRKPLKKLVNATEEVAKGNLDTVIAVTGNDEIALLKSAFNDMVSKLKQSQQALTTSRDVAEYANQAKSQFLTRMSHELRTPLNAILGFAQLLELNYTGKSNSAEKEHVAKIIKSGWHLLELVEEVLDLSRIETNTVSIKREKQNVLPLIQESLEIVRPMIEDNKLTLVNKINEENPYFLNIDPLRFKQIILNLLTNAVKFNRINGKVTIDSDLKDDKQLRISICDEGAGLNKEQQVEVFDAFQRLDADKKAIGGIGIGLNITKNLVELMDGYIGIESEPGQGSCFWVEFPAEKEVKDTSHDEAKIKVDKTSSNKFQVLYVEDDFYNMELVKEILSVQRPEIILLEASTAEKALEILKKEKPQLILMDLNLPGMSGLEALARLQQDKTTKNIPVVAVSADALGDTIEKGKKQGFTDYITKPIRINEIINVVDTALHPKTFH